MKTLHIPHGVTTVIVEDDMSRRHWFLSSFRLPAAYLAHDPQQAIELIRGVEPELIFLDYDLGSRVNSLDVAAYLRDSQFAGRVIVHSQNDLGRMSLKQFLPCAEVMPFGSFEILRTAATQKELLR